MSTLGQPSSREPIFNVPTAVVVALVVLALVHVGMSQLADVDDEHLIWVLAFVPARYTGWADQVPGGPLASRHPGRQPYDTVAMPYGPQILWPDHCVQGTPGAAFRADLDIPHAELVIRKGYDRAIDSYSAFFENDHNTPTGLAGYLRERGFRRVTICGLALDFCVRYSAEDAVASGFAVTVVEDACRGIDLDGSVDATRRTLADLGVAIRPAGSFG